jgi:hypothetical protein
MVVFALAAGCGNKAEDKPPPGPKQPAPLEEDPQCGEKIGPFREWMKGLVADGHVSVITTGVELATLPVGPTPITRGAPVVKVAPAEVVIDGAAVAVPSTTKGADLRAAVRERLASTPGPDVVVLVDAKVPWSVVVDVANGALAADHGRVTFAFTAGSPGAASKPPPSSIDAEIDALLAKQATAADLATPIDENSGLSAKIFADCAAVTQKLFPAIDKLSPAEFDVAVAVGMPDEIEICGCRVELPAVQRLMWAWWGRDMGPALASVKVQLTAPKPGATEITMPADAPWSEASTLIVAAAPQGKPVALK